MDLKKLLCPSKIAIVGAGEKETMAGFVSKMCAEQCTARAEDIYFVSPTKKSAYGKPCYPSLADLPTDIDLVVLCTPKATVCELLRQAHRRGAGAAVVFASGYGETGREEDNKAEKELVALARTLDMAVMGPNCAGFLNFIERIFAFGFLLQAQDGTGKIGLISQSGQICMAAMESTKTAFSYVISAGNCKAVNMEDYLDFLIEDTHTQVVAAYCEGVQDPYKLTASLQKAAVMGKPVVILKVGRSEKSARAVASHTGNLSGSDKNIDAIFKKFGVIRVDDVEELVSVCAALATLPNLPARNALAIVNISGGETTVAADAAWLHGVELPNFSSETAEKLRAVIPPFATAQNPMDVTAGTDGRLFEKILTIILAAPETEMLITSLQITEEMNDVTLFDYLDGIIRCAKNGNGKPIAIVPLIEAGRNTTAAERLRAVGIPILPPPHYGYKVIKYLIEYAQYKERIAMRTLAPTKTSRLSTGRRILAEHESKLLLAEHGICEVHEFIAETADEAVCFAESIGYPVVMKIASSDIPHKSDVGGVKLQIACAEDVRSAFAEICDNVAHRMPEAHIDGILVQRMLPKGLEVIVGVNNDPQFGPIVLLGLGGVVTEVLRDVSLYPAPFGREEALEMIDGLAAKQLFYGYRGEAKRDVSALADMLVKVSAFACAYSDRLLECDINPVTVFAEGEGVGVADALVVLCDKA